MPFDNLLKKVSEAKEKVADLTVKSSEQMGALLEEYKHAVQTLQSLGFSIGKVRVTAGLLPEISTTVKGNVQTVDAKRVSDLLESKREQKLLAAILSALLTVAKLREVVDLSSLRDVVIDITLGIPPKVSIDLQ